MCIHCLIMNEFSWKWTTSVTPVVRVWHVLLLISCNDGFMNLISLQCCTYCRFLCSAKCLDCKFSMPQMYLCYSRAAFIPIHQKRNKGHNQKSKRKCKVQQLLFSPAMKTPLKKSAVLHQAAPLISKQGNGRLSLIGDARGLIKQLWLSLKQTLGTTYLTSD